MHWIWIHAGLSSGSSSWYLWWSGIGSDLGEITLAGLLIGYLQHHNCHTRGCWRLGHPVEGVVKCRKHL